MMSLLNFSSSAKENEKKEKTRKKEGLVEFVGGACGGGACYMFVMVRSFA